MTPGDADEYQAFLASKLADGTARRYCGRARQFFRAALRKRLIQENPFADLQGLNVRSNKAREFFVTRDVTRAVLAVMVDADESPLVAWQLIFALSRYGALRCPSEHTQLVWDDVDWEHDRFTVHSPKTKRWEGKESRVVHLFPELRPFLEAAFNAASDQLGRPPFGTDPVLPILRRQGAKTNLRTQLGRFIKKAGLKAWPKMFNNLRASRATELARSYPGWMAAAWCGHSPEVAEEHYWQITADDWRRAAAELTGDGAEKAVHESGANPGQKAVQTGPKRCTVDPAQQSLTADSVASCDDGEIPPQLPGQDSNLG